MFCRAPKRPSAFCLPPGGRGTACGGRVVRASSNFSLEQPFRHFLAKMPPSLAQGRLPTEHPSATRRAWGVKTFPCGNDLLEICFSMQEPASILLTQNQASSTPAAYRCPFPHASVCTLPPLRKGKQAKKPRWGLFAKRVTENAKNEARLCRALILNIFSGRARVAFS